MKKNWSLSWLASKQPRKQRKYRYNAPLHKRQKMLSAHLSKDLQEKHKKRSIPVRKGDKVRILRGQFKDKIGKVERVALTRYKLYIEGAEIKRGEGKAQKYPIDPSNVIIIDLERSDKKRVEAISRK